MAVFKIRNRRGDFVEPAEVFSVGLSGLVPSPTLSDSTKYLRGDGTWSTITEVDTGDSDCSEQLTALKEDVNNNTKQIDSILLDIEEIKKNGIAPAQPIITSFTNNKKINEKGSTITSIVFTWKNNATLTSLSLDTTTLTPSLTTYTLTETITDNRTFKLNAAKNKETLTLQTSISFINGLYYGVSSSFSLDSSSVLTLTKKLQSTKNTTFTVDPTTNEYIYYAIPSSYGTPTFFVGGFEGGFTEYGTLNFTNTFSYSEQYVVYKSDNSNLGHTTVTVQ